jgi:SP family sugar:H+ symporter-like MFS transporter
MIYETKGLALEEVDELYGAVDKAWKSKAFRPAVSFRDVQAAGKKRASLAEEYEMRRTSQEGTTQDGAAVQGK